MGLIFNLCNGSLVECCLILIYSSLNDVVTRSDCVASSDDGMIGE